LRALQVTALSGYLYKFCKDERRIKLQEALTQFAPPRLEFVGAPSFHCWAWLPAARGALMVAVASGAQAFVLWLQLVHYCVCSTASAWVAISVAHACGWLLSLQHDVAAGVLVCARCAFALGGGEVIELL
jgi:hypothetical protein